MTTKNILYWPPGRYVNSANTDIRKTFDRVRAEMAKQKPANVKPMRRKA